MKRSPGRCSVATAAAVALAASAGEGGAPAVGMIKRDNAPRKPSAGAYSSAHAAHSSSVSVGTTKAPRHASKQRLILATWSPKGHRCRCRRSLVSAASPLLVLSSTKEEASASRAAKDDGGVSNSDATIAAVKRRTSSEEVASAAVAIAFSKAAVIECISAARSLATPVIICSTFAGALASAIAH